MAKRFQIMLSDEQYDYLREASERTSVSMAELVRRALDTKYPALTPRPARMDVTLAVWRRPREHGQGRRSGIRLD